MPQYMEEEEDELDRLQREWVEETEAKLAPCNPTPAPSPQVEDDGERQAPEAPARRVRIPNAVPPSAPTVEPESFDDQLAALVGKVGEAQAIEQPIEGDDESPFPKCSGGEKRKGQHPPGLKRAARFKLTDTDKRVLLFVSAVRYATARTVALMTGDEPSTVARRLKVLETRGFLFKREGILLGNLYALTAAGQRSIGSRISAEKPNYSPLLVRHNVVCANVLALLVAGKQIAGCGLLLPEYPVGSHFLTDRQLTREVNAYNLAVREAQGALTAAEKQSKKRWVWPADKMWSEKRARTKHWARGVISTGEVHWEGEEPWTWLAIRREDRLHSGMFPASLEPNTPLKEQTWMREEWSTHVPDLVLTYPRDPATHAPRAVAIEVEMTVKDREKIRNAVQAYVCEMEEGGSYGSVVWLCRNEQVLFTVRDLMKELVPGAVRARFKAGLLTPDALASVSLADREARLSPEAKAARNANLVPKKPFNGGYTHAQRAAVASRQAAEGGE